MLVEPDAWTDASMNEEAKTIVMVRWERGEPVDEMSGQLMRGIHTEALKSLTATIFEPVV